MEENPNRIESDLKEGNGKNRKKQLPELPMRREPDARYKFQDDSSPLRIKEGPPSNPNSVEFLQYLLEELLKGLNSLFRASPKVPRDRPVIANIPEHGTKKGPSFVRYLMEKPKIESSIIEGSKQGTPLASDTSERKQLPELPMRREPDARYKFQDDPPPPRILEEGPTSPFKLLIDAANYVFSNGALTGGFAIRDTETPTNMENPYRIERFHLQESPHLLEGNRKNGTNPSNSYQMSWNSIFAKMSGLLEEK